MNRRTFSKKLVLLSIGSIALTSDAKKKGKKKKKDKDDDKKTDKVENKKLKGTIIVETRGITKSYKFLSDKAYTISKSLQSKVKDFEGMQVTIFGSFFQSKVLTIAGVTK
ncbi:MAG: hypothetical protein MK132_27200 [Lentisphaerales bacterium]|nr:hypothetical protein [Lentisphaerales bacterium]